MGTERNELQQRNRELTILITIAQALNRTHALDEVLQLVLAHAADLFGLDTGWIWLLDPETGQHYLAAAQHLPPGLANAPHRMEGGCHCLSTYRDGDLAEAANINVVQCSRLHDLVDGTNGLAYHASVPITVHGNKRGLLNLASSDWRKLAADDLRLLYTIGDMLGIAVERAQLFRQSSELGAERERNRLAREIHDTLAQGLTAVTLHLETAEHLLDATTAAPLQTAVTTALGLTRATLDDARRSVRDLRAAPLDGSTLVDALAALVQPLTGVVFTVVGAGEPLPSRIEVGLYRIAQEALANVQRHAQATAVRLGLQVTPTQIALTLQDNGVGFDPANIPAQRYGITGISERTRLLGGTLDLQSTPGAGTRVAVCVPR